MLIPSFREYSKDYFASLSRRVNANSQLLGPLVAALDKLIKKGEC